MLCWAPLKINQYINIHLNSCETVPLRDNLREKAQLLEDHVAVPVVEPEQGSEQVGEEEHQAQEYHIQHIQHLFLPVTTGISLNLIFFYFCLLKSS